MGDRKIKPIVATFNNAATQQYVKNMAALLPALKEASDNLDAQRLSLSNASTPVVRMCYNTIDAVQRWLKVADEIIAISTQQIMTMELEDGDVSPLLQAAMELQKAKEKSASHELVPTLQNLQDMIVKSFTIEGALIKEIGDLRIKITNNLFELVQPCGKMLVDKLSQLIPDSIKQETAQEAAAAIVAENLRQEQAEQQALVYQQEQASKLQGWSKQLGQELEIIHQNKFYAEPQRNHQQAQTTHAMGLILQAAKNVVIISKEIKQYLNNNYVHHTPTALLEPVHDMLHNCSACINHVECPDSGLAVNMAILSDYPSLTAANIKTIKKLQQTICLKIDNITDIATTIKDSLVCFQAALADENIVQSYQQGNFSMAQQRKHQP